jgi:hypothetical protein
MTITDDWTVIIPPCPPWCVLPAYHGYVERYSDGNPARIHCGDDGNLTAWPARVEIVLPGGVDPGDALVTVSTGEGDQLTPDEARALASELIRAADAIEQG